MAISNGGLRQGLSEAHGLPASDFSNKFHAPSNFSQAHPSEFMKTLFKYGKQFLDNPALFSCSEASYAAGDLIVFPFPGQRIFVSKTPEYFEHILVDQKDKFGRSRVYWKPLRSLIGESVGTSEGESWKWTRRLQAPFFRQSAVPAYLGKAHSTILSALSAYQASPPEDPFRFFSNMNARIILESFFGAEGGENGTCPVPHEEMMKRVCEGDAYLLWKSKLPWRELMSRFTATHYRVSAGISDFVKWSNQLADNRAASGDGEHCMFDELIEKQGEDPDSLGEIRLRNEMLAHLGSMDTLSAAQLWTLIMLARYPEEQAKVREELYSVSQGSPFSPEDLPELPYLEQVIWETMRLFPPSHALLRDCTIPHDMKGHHLKQGDVMYLSLMAQHRHPDLWEDPLEFRPSRFTPENKARFSRFFFIPFGAGPHKCIGHHVGVALVKLLVANWVLSFRFSLSQDKITPLPSSTLIPHGEIRFSIQPVVTHTQS